MDAMRSEAGQPLDWNIDLYVVRHGVPLNASVATETRGGRAVLRDACTLDGSEKSTSEPHDTVE
jgi:hypothetical protein